MKNILYLITFFLLVSCSNSNDSDSNNSENIDCIPQTLITSPSIQQIVYNFEEGNFIYTYDLDSENRITSIEKINNVNPAIWNEVFGYNSCPVITNISNQYATQSQFIYNNDGTLKTYRVPKVGGFELRYTHYGNKVNTKLYDSYNEETDEFLQYKWQADYNFDNNDNLIYRNSVSTGNTIEQIEYDSDDNPITYTAFYPESSDMTPDTYIIEYSDYINPYYIILNNSLSKKNKHLIEFSYNISGQGLIYDGLAKKLISKLKRIDNNTGQIDSLVVTVLNSTGNYPTSIKETYYSSQSSEERIIQHNITYN